MSGGQGQLYLVGFMGSGKSTVGPLLADFLGRVFVDLDHLIQQAAGKTVPEIFEQDGESHFRKLESECLKVAAAGRPAVIALGGGAFQEPENRHVMSETGTTVWLQASLETVRSRALGDHSRPLARNRRLFEELYARRLEVYETADLQVSTEGKTPAEVCKELAALLAETSRRPPVAANSPD